MGVAENFPNKDKAHEARSLRDSMKINLVVGCEENQRSPTFVKFPTRMGIDLSFCPALQRCDLRVQYFLFIFNWDGTRLPAYLKKTLQIRESVAAAIVDDAAVSESTSNGQVFLGALFEDANGTEFVVRHIDPDQKFVHVEQTLNEAVMEDDVPDSHADLDVMDYDECALLIFHYYDSNNQ